MRIGLIFLAAAALVAANASAQDVTARAAIRRAASAYQGRNRSLEQTEQFSRKIRIGRDGRVSIANIAGDIVVTGGSGDQVSIDATKRTRGDQNELANVHIEVEERAGRVDVRTVHSGRHDRVSVDYTIVVPASASVELHSVSGNLKVSDVQGLVRAETVSGHVTTSATPRVDVAKSVSGNVDLAGAAVEGDLSASSVSGAVRARGVKARSLHLGSVSGDIAAIDVTCENLDAKTVSGSVEFSGTLARSGRYDLNSHSGTVRLTLSGNTGFEINASTFSGSIRSELSLTIGGETDRAGRRRGLSNRSIRAAFGDGSALLTIRTFSGDIVISKGR